MSGCSSSLGDTIEGKSIQALDCVPGVDSVEPSAEAESVNPVYWGEPRTFSVSGYCFKNLSKPLVAYIDQCKDIHTTVDDNWNATIACTPSYSTGRKYGVIKEGQNGKKLLEFHIVVMNNPCPTCHD